VHFLNSFHRVQRMEGTNDRQCDHAATSDEPGKSACNARSRSAFRGSEHGSPRIHRLIVLATGFALWARHAAELMPL